MSVPCQLSFAPTSSAAPAAARSYILSSHRPRADRSTTGPGPPSPLSAPAGVWARGSRRSSFVKENTMNCPHIALITPETYRGGAPREMYRWLRQNEPEYWHEDPALGEQFWAVTRQRALDYVSKNPTLFSSRERT